MRVVEHNDLVCVKDREALRDLIEFLGRETIDYRVLGWGANQILKALDNGIYIKLNFSFDKKVLEQEQKEYKLPASVSLAVLTSAASKFGISGWEVFTGIPASLGGAVYMNAGTSLGEMSSIVQSVEVVSRNAEFKNYFVSEKDFSYRKNNFLSPGDVITGVTLKHAGKNTNTKDIINNYLKFRVETQPLKEKTCGCMFKNHYENDMITCRAGRSIDIMGLKGLIYKDLQVGHKHANFMVNLGRATHEDVDFFIKMIQSELYLQYGVKFEIEFEI